jgi:hypothetical protein
MKRKIADAQKSAFHCFVRALKLAHLSHQKPQDLHALASNLLHPMATLCESIVAGIFLAITYQLQ